MLRRNRKWISFIAVLVIMALTVTGCGGGNSEQSAAKAEETEKTFTIAVPEEIEGADISQINWENIVHYLMYEPLVAYDLELKELMSSAAKSYEVSADGTEITFKLPEDACFANGDPMTAEEVKKSFERHKEISPYSSDLDPIKEIVAQDAQTIVFKLDNSAAFLWPVLASTYGGIVDVKKAEELGKEAFNREAVGNGSFLLEEWVQGSHITLVKNPKYKTNYSVLDNKGPANIDKVTIRFISDNFTRVSELEAGNVDLAINIPIENLDGLKNNENIQMYDYMQTGIDYISFNTDVEPLNDVKVRQAIAMAVDKDELKLALKDTVDPRSGILSPAQICYDEAVEKELKDKYGFNIDNAKALLAEAGYKDENNDGIVEKDGKPLSITLMVALDNPYFKQSGPILQAQLKKVGVDLQLREYEIKYIKQMMKEKNYQMATRYYWWSDPDILYYIFHSEAAAVWSNPEVDKLLDEARYIMDVNERTAKYSEIQRKVMDEMPIISLFSEYQFMAAGKNVKGLKVSVDGKPYLNDVSK
ncbi:MAG: ABC transporter substrate-binding protein [Clostridiaceae bacterium]|nr:ABC transporter substrate-binding protein [Clostridiaceae bacterium]